MIERRPFESLGHADHGWLDAHHHFSFANYYDPSRMGWGPIRVWNDDTIQPGMGFPPHPHRDMEIITYVRSGAITHEDSLGNRGRTEAGDVQVMSAGRGVRHSEYNLEGEATTLFQIWLETAERGAEPSWGAKPFPKGDRSGRFVTLASGFEEEEEEEALRILTPARVLGATLKTGEAIEYDVAERHHAYLVSATGRLRLNEIELNARDGAAIPGGTSLRLEALEESEIVMVDAAG